MRDTADSDGCGRRAKAGKREQRLPARSARGEVPRVGKAILPALIALVPASGSCWTLAAGCRDDREGTQAGAEGRAVWFPTVCNERCGW